MWCGIIVSVFLYLFSCVIRCCCMVLLLFVLMTAYCCFCCRWACPPDLNVLVCHTKSRQEPLGTVKNRSNTVRNRRMPPISPAFHYLIRGNNRQNPNVKQTVCKRPRVFCGLADLQTNQWVFCGPSCGRQSAKYPLQSSERRPTQSTIVIIIVLILVLTCC